MDLFDGKYKTKPLINLSGSSKSKTKDDLIKQALVERRRREIEKLELSSALKIQSFYRSYLIRKRIKQEFRNKFDKLVDANSNDFKAILRYFVQFYDTGKTSAIGQRKSKIDDKDNERLIKLSNLVLKNKESIIESFYSTFAQPTNAQKKLDTYAFTFSKFLIFILRLLNNSNANKTANVSSSLILRIIDYFTNSASHARYDQRNRMSCLIFTYLIRRSYINELVKFAIQRIPTSCEYMTGSIEIGVTISDLIYRSFVYLNDSLGENSDVGTKFEIINAICDQLFARAYLPQCKYIINNLIKLINTNKTYDFLISFIRYYKLMLQNEDVKKDEDNQYNEFIITDPNETKFIFLKCFCICKLYSNVISKLTNEQFNDYLFILKNLIKKITLTANMKNLLKFTQINDQELMDVDANDTEEYLEQSNKPMLDELFNMFESEQFSSKIEMFLLDKKHRISNETNDESSESVLSQFCLSISYICDFILINSNLKPHKSVLLKTLAFNKCFLIMLWKINCSLSIKQPNHSSTSSNQQMYLIQMLGSGSCPEIYTNYLCKLVAPLSTFCSLYSLFLLPILDEEFLRGEAIFSKAELIQISSILKNACIGLVNLMHPDTSASILLNNTITTLSPFNASKTQVENSDKNRLLIKKSIKQKAKYFTHLFQVCTQLVQRMHTRDIRFGFCPEDHWIKSIAILSPNRLLTIFQQTQDASILTRVKFGQMSYLFSNDDEDDEDNDLMDQQQDAGDLDFKFNLNDIRILTILQELPFTISFNERVEILENFVSQDPMNPQTSTYKIRIRRDYLYEDAFENLSLENAPNLKSSRIIIEMINRLGLDEAGIDGGGLFREFMIQLLETGFDPNRGIFSLTSDGFLYPNPNVSMLIENYEQHYFFLGRMLAKAIQCKLLTQLKFAGFFLQKILSKYIDTRLDIDYLASLDPEIYKNLLYLKDYKSNVKDLELNFALNSSQLGETQTVELKPGGKDILVTNDNKIEYIHLLSDYKLNKQIHEQVKAFRNGISNVINLDLLRLFNFNEIQNLISGPNDFIDVSDWKRYTVYTGLYNPDHEVIINFWNIVESFSEDHKRKLLKFATSRSKPPLFGFQNLIPNFAIQSSGSQERLPTASTCLNLLKLPPIEDYSMLKEKLICAIESDSGFELS